MTSPAQIVNESNRQHSDNLIAHFKAKFGVSIRVMSDLLNIDPIQINNNLAKDSFTHEQNQLVGRIWRIIDHLIAESELLQEQAPTLSIYEHQMERLRADHHKLAIKKAKLTSRVKYFENMSFFKRLISLFKGNK